MMMHRCIFQDEPSLFTVSYIIGCNQLKVFYLHNLFYYFLLLDPENHRFAGIQCYETIAKQLTNSFVFFHTYFANDMMCSQ